MEAGGCACGALRVVLQKVIRTTVARLRQPTKHTRGSLTVRAGSPMASGGRPSGGKKTPSTWGFPLAFFGRMPLFRNILENSCTPLLFELPLQASRMWRVKGLESPSSSLPLATEA